MDLLRPYQNRRLRVIDLGGSPGFWTNQPEDWTEHWKITLANPGKIEDGPKDKFERLSLGAEEIDPSTLREKFDLIFSNSMIEHVGRWSTKLQIANSIIASGVPYFVQTPYYWFPLEPHFLIPGFQWMPRPVRHYLISRKSRIFRTCYFHDYHKLHGVLEETEMLTERDLRELFPSAHIQRERLLGLTKSLVAYQLESL